MSTRLLTGPCRTCAGSGRNAAAAVCGRCDGRGTRRDTPPADGTPFAEARTEVMAYLDALPATHRHRQAIRNDSGPWTTDLRVRAYRAAITGGLRAAIEVLDRAAAEQDATGWTGAAPRPLQLSRIAW